MAGAGAKKGADDQGQGGRRPAAPWWLKTSRAEKRAKVASKPENGVVSLNNSNRITIVENLNRNKNTYINNKAREYCRKSRIDEGLAAHFVAFAQELEAEAEAEPQSDAPATPPSQAADGGDRPGDALAEVNRAFAMAATKAPGWKIKNNHDEPRWANDWPEKTYSEMNASAGWDIITYLTEGEFEERVRLGLTLAELRKKDPSAASAINNYTRKGRALPPHLHVPTVKEKHDLMAVGVTLEDVKKIEALSRSLRNRLAAKP